MTFLICDMAAWNTAQMEEVGLLDYKQMLVGDGDLKEWDRALTVPSLGSDWDELFTPSLLTTINTILYNNWLQPVTNWS